MQHWLSVITIGSHVTAVVDAVVLVIVVDHAAFVLSAFVAVAAGVVVITKGSHVAAGIVVVVPVVIAVAVATM